MQFEPLRPASRGALIAGFVLGPILWLVALVVGALLVGESAAIALGVAVALASFVIALLVLSLVYVARRRQEKRFADRAAEALLALVALYPVCTAAMWIAGGVLFRVLEEPRRARRARRRLASASPC